MNATVPNLQAIPAVVLGGTGYVAGELLRLLAGHPQVRALAVVSDSQPGAPIAQAFPHLRPAYPEQVFVGLDEALDLIARAPRTAIFGAAPHGVSAALIAKVIAAGAGRDARIVDISADHRFPTPGAYAAVYGAEHADAAQLDRFTCAVPEHLARTPEGHIAHPGCFATAMLLALVPLIALDVIEPSVYVSGVTGSTGSGRSPGAGTHHPDRHSDLYAYKPLAHRHAPEVEAVTRAVTGKSVRVHFVPHSGPFARGIHVTLQAKLRTACTTRELNERLADFYAGSAFVSITGSEPHVKQVVASNHAMLRAATDGEHVAVMAVLDNLTKGAAGGAIQWMNRLHGLTEDAGLSACAPGWT